MNRYQLSRQARQDLVGIADQIKRNRAPAALSVVDSIEARCRQVAEFPESGRMRDELSPGLRSVLVDPYLIFYRISADVVQVIRILHGRRDLDSLFRKTTD